MSNMQRFSRKKKKFAPAAALGITLSGGLPVANAEAEIDPGVSRRQIQENNIKLGEWLHLRVPDPRGGPGKEIFTHLVKRVSFVCPGSSTGLWRRKHRA